MAFYAFQSSNLPPLWLGGNHTEGIVLRVMKCLARRACVGVTTSLAALAPGFEQ